MGPYKKYLCKYAYCNAHIIRELTRVDDETGQKWAVRLRSFLVKAKEIAEIYHNKGLNVPADLLQQVSQSYLQLVEVGFADNQPPPFKEKRLAGGKNSITHSIHGNQLKDFGQIRQSMKNPGVDLNL